MNNKKRILLSGGGSGGSVSPLLALRDELRGDCEFLWIGTNFGPEKEMVLKEGIDFKSIQSGKLRRYFSLKNFIDIFKIIYGFFESFFIILKWKPDLAISAGSFVSVPVIWAARILGKKIIVHQQDVRPGLANKLMAPFADMVTVTFEKSLNDYGKKAVVTGNPVRQNLKTKKDKYQIIKDWGLSPDLPIVLVMGGGTGAKAINELIAESLPALSEFCQIIHITGKNKNDKGLTSKNYHCFEFLNREEMAECYLMSDGVVSRSGIGSLTEITYLEKPSIIIPMPDTHQEENARIFEQGRAAVVLNQKELNADIFIRGLNQLLFDQAKRSLINGNLKNIMTCCANKNMANIIKQILSK